MQAATNPPTALQQLAAFVAARSGSAAREPEVQRHAKRAVLDWLAALYPGTRVTPTTLLVQGSAEELGHGRSSVPGFGTTAFAPTAAWINGTASHAIEYDDIYREAVYHPGSPVVAAALAVAEARDADGADFLAAIIGGYELSCRVGAALQPAHVRRFHATGTIGSLGAAAAAALLLCPGDARAVAHAVATATTFASGLQQAIRSENMTKPLHAGHAAAIGVRAAQGAAQGLTGALDIFDGPIGLAVALADGVDWAQALQGLGAPWAITRITHKVHACCGHGFPTIDAVLALRERHQLRHEDIEAIHATTSAQALEAIARFDPATPYECKFSMPFGMAHALVHGSVALDAFQPERLADERIRALMRRCTLAEDPQATAAFPGQRIATVEITLKDGRRFSHRQPHRRGDPESPLTDADLDAKFERLAGPVLGAQRAARLQSLVWRLEAIRVRELDLAAALA